ncbi:MAG: CAP domain-containing protein [Candidatus Anstonellaceae archaeon]
MYKKYTYTMALSFLTLANVLTAKPPFNKQPILDTNNDTNNIKIYQDLAPIAFPKNILAIEERFKEIRKEHSLDTDFVLHPNFCAVAKKFAKYLIEAQKISHNSKDYPFFKRVLELVGYTSNIGETIVVGYAHKEDKELAQEVFNTLFKSPSHKEIILKKKILYVGIGFEEKVEKWIVVIILGFKKI